MKKFSLKINPFAEEDLEDSFDYYEHQKEGLGKEFLDEVKTRLNRVTENPNQFPKNRKGIRKALTNRFPFIIFFYVKDIVINVFAIFHSSRDPKNWGKRV
jgi:plasmid stabilization system protein ParE